jgi:genome maintenance exonuclease 1
LDEWRERVGEEEAARVSKEATDIGSSMHNMLEAYIRDVPYEATGIPEEIIAKKLFKPVRMMGLRPLQEVWGVEVALHFDDLFAGRTDLVGIYDGLPSIIDYKSAKYFKKAEYLEDYKLQTAAYSIAHDDMFPSEKIEQAVLLIGTRPNPEYKVPPNYQRVVIGPDELKVYKNRWIEVLDGYYQNH